MRAIKLALGAILLIGLMARAQTRTVLDGVYTTAQAQRGEAAYMANCSPCHRDSLEGNAEALSLKGTRFIESWRDDTLDGVFLHMKTRMPRRPVGEPGSLPAQTYVDILTWILKVNTFPEGNTELDPGMLQSTLFIGKEGPKPLPTNAMVEVVGCLTPAGNENWTLTSAGEPSRTRNAEATTADDLKRAASKPMGNLVYGLRNLMDFREGFNPATYQGHKVLAKGVLTRQPKNDRIYVTALDSIGPVCPR